ncbi:MAG: hypothetical protein LBD57_05220 [Endomicrobium sp.]|jgi:hypothetical protein|uniref:hypothetical protein n=1 Tax=Candidatus Endomicrobiellum cubanum TaxID=3242325 RepID=UPI00282BC788|nr:hypothetical protein [Endomicrobium sp.]
MLKKMLSLLLVFFNFNIASFAVKTYVVDTPTYGSLSYGSYDFGFRCFSSGNVLSNIDFGVFKFLNIGMSWEIDKLIGYDNIKVAIPTLNVKLKIYEGSMVLPGIAIGYDGQGYFIDTSLKSGYVQKARGLYFVLGREIFFDGFILNIGANVNDFSVVKVYGFINSMIPIFKEIMYFMTEYDNINYFPDARLNWGLKLSLSEYLDVDCIIRDCFGKDDITRVPNERILKLSYSGKF